MGKKKKKIAQCNLGEKLKTKVEKENYYKQDNFYWI